MIVEEVVEDDSSPVRAGPVSLVVGLRRQIAVDGTGSRPVVTSTSVVDQEALESRDKGNPDNLGNTFSIASCLSVLLAGSVRVVGCIARDIGREKAAVCLNGHGGKGSRR